MKDEVQDKAPLEGCGLIAGLRERASAIIPLFNTEQSPVRYRLDPQEQLDAFRYIDENAWVLLGIFHSHPSGPAMPSRADIEEAYYPDSAYLIWSPTNLGWQCRGFSIQEGKVSEIQLLITA